MPQTNHEEETTGERENDSPMTITRRDAVIAAAIGGMGQAGLFAGTFTNVKGKPQNVEVGVSEFNDGATMYRQYAGGEVSELTLSSSTSVSVEYGSMSDEYIDCTVGFSWEPGRSRSRGRGLARANGRYETVGEARANTQPNGGTVTFTANDLWGGGELDLVDDSKSIGGYDEISVPAVAKSKGQGPPADIGQSISDETVFRIRFRFVSANATLTEEEVLEFTLNACHPLGFGQTFGKCFGKDHPEHWPENWDSI